MRCPEGPCACRTAGRSKISGTLYPHDVGGYVREGFRNIVLWGPDVWSNDPSIGLDAKVAQLEQVARGLGLVAPAVEEVA